MLYYSHLFYAQARAKEYAAKAAQGLRATRGNLPYSISFYVQARAEEYAAWAAHE